LFSESSITKSSVGPSGFGPACPGNVLAGPVEIASDVTGRCDAKPVRSGRQGENADAGYPFVASYVADNDLALGRIVDTLSHSKYWANMVVFVTEDDSQGGIDHIDAHRSLLMVMGPYVKQGYVSHVHTSIVSIIKTINLIFGVPYLNQYDAAAADLTDFFTATPDVRPYTFKPSDTRVFDPSKLKTVKSIYKYMSAPHSAPLDDPETIEQWMKIDQANSGRTPNVNPDPDVDGD